MANETVTQTEANDFRTSQDAKRTREFARALEVANSHHETEGHHSGPLETIWGPRDRFDRRMTQVFALLTVVSSEGLAPFDTLNDDIRMNYLDAIRDLVGAARVDAEISFTQLQDAANS